LGGAFVGLHVTSCERDLRDLMDEKDRWGDGVAVSLSGLRIKSLYNIAHGIPLLSGLGFGV